MLLVIDMVASLGDAVCLQRIFTIMHVSITEDNARGIDSNIDLTTSIHAIKTI